MSLSLSLSQSLSQRAEIVVSITCSFGETGGDIPVYSLHKIASLLKREPIELSKELVNILRRSLLQANRTYKEESGKDWNCLTSNNLVTAIEHTQKMVAAINADGIKQLPQELQSQRAAVKAIFDRKRDECMTKIKKWFETHYDKLLYITDGRIPWIVVQKLRSNLGLWISGAANPFTQDITEFVMEVAKEKGIRASTPEDAWEAMGGQLFGGKE